MNVEAIKQVSSLIVASGVSTVVGNVIKNGKPDDMKFVKKVSFGIGAFVISSMVAAKASDFVDEQIDKVDGTIQETRATVIKLKEKLAEEQVKTETEVKHDYNETTTIFSSDDTE